MLPNPVLFASLVSWGEMLVGLSILIGDAFRLGAGTGIFLRLNYMLLQSRFFPGYDGTLLVAQVDLLMGGSGRMLGVDQYPQRRWPRWGIW